MRSQFRGCIDRQFETPAFGKFGLRRHLGNKANQPGGCLFDTKICPTAGKKEEHDTRAIKRRTLMRSSSDMEVSRQHCPATPLIKILDPFDVRGVLGEAISQCNYMMLTDEQSAQ